MKKRAKEPAIPPERQGTLRKEIITLLETQTLSARDLSSLVRIPEKETYEHLEHIQKTTNKREYKLTILPAKCLKCGFSFKKREKLRKPGKCPVCKSGHIQPPRFTATEAA